VKKNTRTFPRRRQINYGPRGGERRTRKTGGHALWCTPPFLLASIFPSLAYPSLLVSYALVPLFSFLILLPFLPRLDAFFAAPFPLSLSFAPVFSVAFFLSLLCCRLIYWGFFFPSITSVRGGEAVEGSSTARRWRPCSRILSLICPAILPVAMARPADCKAHNRGWRVIEN
jgi:hypothetical protein